MNKINYLLALSMTMLFACKNNSNKESDATDNNQKTEMYDNAANSKNSLDWVGVYEGTFNCQGCDNSKTTVKLRPDNTYHFKNDNAEEKALIKWNEEGAIITLSSNGKKFKVAENRLIALNNEGQPLKDKNNNEISFKKKETAETFEFDKETTNEETANKIKQFLRTTFKDEISKNSLKGNDREFSFYEVDLNADGKNEYFVSLSGTYNCGVGGCSHYLLNNDFTTNTYFTVAVVPIFRSSAKTNGWNDIIMRGELDTSGSIKSYIHLKYNAKTKSYPSNPTLVKLSKVAPSGHDMTMWYDGYGYAKPFSF